MGAGVLLALAVAGRFPTLPQVVATPAQWISPGWERVAEAHGDLNGDGRSDVALVTWPKGEDERPAVEQRPYHLLVGFKTVAGGYRLVVDDHALLHAAIGMDDGPLDSDSLAVRKGSLHVSRWLLRGREQHHFRWDGHDFRLIGYDLAYSDGRCVRDTSMNFLTRRATETAEGLSESGETRATKRRITRGPPTMREAGKEGFYPGMLMTGPAPDCIVDGQSL